MTSQMESKPMPVQNDPETRPTLPEHQTKRDNRCVTVTEKTAQLQSYFEAAADRVEKVIKAVEQRSAIVTPPMCERHGKSRILDLERSAGETMAAGDFRLFYASCEDCEAEREELAVQERLIKGGVPKNLAHATIYNWKARSEADLVTLAGIKDWLLKRRGILILTGEDYGVGKSHLAVGCLREMKLGRFETQNGLLLQLRRSYSDRSAEDIIEACKRARALVIDEIGLSAGGRDEMPMLHEIISHFYTSGKPLILTSNCEPKKSPRKQRSHPFFEDVMGPRLIDRFRESAVLFTLKGESWRSSRRTK